MGLFRLVARVGCWRGGAIRPLEEWSPIRYRAVDRTRLTDPLALFPRTPFPRTRRVAARTLCPYLACDGEIDAFQRLGFSALAGLWQHPRGRPGAPVRPRRLHQCRQPPCAQGAEQPRALALLRSARRRI